MLSGTSRARDNRKLKQGRVLPTVPLAPPPPSAETRLPYPRPGRGRPHEAFTIGMANITCAEHYCLCALAAALHAWTQRCRPAARRAGTRGALALALAPALMTNAVRSHSCGGKGLQELHDSGMDFFAAFSHGSSPAVTLAGTGNSHSQRSRYSTSSAGSSQKLGPALKGEVSRRPTL